MTVRKLAHPLNLLAFWAGAGLLTAAAIGFMASGSWFGSWSLGAARPAVVPEGTLGGLATAGGSLLAFSLAGFVLSTNSARQWLRMKAKARDPEI